VRFERRTRGGGMVEVGAGGGGILGGGKKAKPSVKIQLLLTMWENATNQRKGGRAKLSLNTKRTIYNKRDTTVSKENRRGGITQTEGNEELAVEPGVEKKWEEEKNGPPSRINQVRIIKSNQAVEGAPQKKAWVLGRPWRGGGKGETVVFFPTIEPE